MVGTDDYLLDDEDSDDGLGGYVIDNSINEEGEEGGAEEEGEGEKQPKSMAVSEYDGLLSGREASMIVAYDEFEKGINEENLSSRLIAIVNQIPKHTSAKLKQDVVKGILDSQGHNRYLATIYNPEDVLTDRDVRTALGEDTGSDDFNKEYSKALKKHVARFVEYLSTRDLSKDSILSASTKKKQLPAFIIYLFSIGSYDLIMDCPTMPPEYDKQIKNALLSLEHEKYKIVEELADRYDEEGRSEVAAKVRKLKLAWFNRQPSQIKTYTDVQMTDKDVKIYKEFRSRFLNVSKSITKEAASDLIEVVIDKKKSIYKKLKDKGQRRAIEDVKALYKQWASENGVQSDAEFAHDLIWNDRKS